MATLAVLPSTLRQKLDEAARHVRRRRAVRGSSLVVLTLVLLGAAALLADGAFDLAAGIRTLLLLAWLVGGATVACVALILPLTRRLDLDALAALVEEKYPDLGERLTTAVELSGERESHHGSPALIALLVEETEARTSRLDFLQAVPLRHGKRFTAAAGIALLLAVIPALLWPGSYRELAERFFVPWQSSGTSIRFALEVTPGDAYAARGRPLTLAAVVQPKHQRARLPEHAFLVWTDADGQQQKQRMRADRADAFSFRLDKVDGDLTYHVEAGRAVSDTFRVTAVEPPQLRAESPSITVTPPEYAKATIEAQTLHGFAELTALHHGRVRFDLGFVHPVVSASLEWSEADSSRKKDPAKRVVPLELTADRLQAHVELPAKESGSYRIVAVAEHDIRTEWDARPLTVQVDQPPVFVTVAGVGKAKASDEGIKVVLPYDRIPLEVSLADDIAVEKADLEYRINSGPVLTENISLNGKGTRQATARYEFKLADKALKENDEVHYRLRVADNRRVPEAKLEPHVVHYPPERWLRLQVARQAEPLRQQEIMAQRDDLNRKLDAIKDDLVKEKNAVERLRQNTEEQPALKPDQAKTLKDLRQDNRDIEAALREVARDATETPALQPIADRAQDVADQEMRRSDKAMQEAGKPSKPDERNKQLKDTDRELASALRRLDELRDANDRLAQERLDQLKLELAAQRQQQLADRAAELAAKDPVKDPAGQDRAEDLKREQGELGQDLKQLTEQSDTLKRALDQANAEKAQQLADKARELAQAQRDLKQAAEETDKQERVAQLAGLAKKQQELAEKAGRLADETRPATQAARSTPLKTEDAQKAAEALKQGDAAEALKRQDQSAKELDRLAGDLDKAINLARDPREAARQLARLQNDLRNRVFPETQKTDTPAPLAERLQPLRKEQEAISRAAEQLSVQPQNQAQLQARKDAAEKAGAAAKALEMADTRQATERMEQARRALEQLANVLPSLEQRRQQAQADVARLRKKQDEIARDAEQAVKKIEKENTPGERTPEQLSLRLADAAKRQADLAEQLSRLDAPNQEARRQQAEEALNRALDDLMNGKPSETGASQQEARKQLERLEQALAGKKPADDGASTARKPAENAERPSPQQLAKGQRELAQETEKAQSQAKQAGEKGEPAQREALSRLAQQQQKLNEQAAKLPSDQEQKTVQQARSAMNQARDALAKNDAEQAQRKQREAADALDRLAKKNTEKPAAPQTASKDDQPAAQGLPSKQQAEQGRQLAQEQRQLRDEVERLTRQQPQATPTENPLGELAQKQQELAREAGELAKNVGREQGQQAEPTQQAQQAARSTQQTANQMQAGSPQQAQQSGQQAAQQLRQLTQQLAQTPRGKNADPQSPDAVPQARQLAQRQEELNKKLDDLMKDAPSQRAQQEARQEDLRKQTGELMEEFNGLAQQMSRPQQARQSIQQAAESSQKAQKSMQQAQRECKECNKGGAAQAQQQAAQSLDKAAQQASQAGQSMNAGPGSQPQGSPQTGQSLQQAQGQMNQAQRQLGQGQPQGAQSSMSRAAQALQQAARQLSQENGQAKVATQPGFKGAAPEGLPDWSLLGPDLKQYAGKRWGDLPGSLQTKIIQDMQKKYGDDYARVIKLYFEQLADTKKSD